MKPDGPDSSIAVTRKTSGAERLKSRHGGARKMSPVGRFLHPFIWHGSFHAHHIATFNFETNLSSI